MNNVFKKIIVYVTCVLVLFAAGFFSGSLWVNHDKQGDSGDLLADRAEIDRSGDEVGGEFSVIGDGIRAAEQEGHDIGNGINQAVKIAGESRNLSDQLVSGLTEARGGAEDLVQAARKHNDEIQQLADIAEELERINDIAYERYGETAPAGDD